MPPRTLLSSEQRTRLFAIPSDSVEMARHYLFGAEDLALIRTKRRSINRLGFAVQLCLLWYPGLGMGPAEQPPEGMIAFVARSTRRAIRRLRRLPAAGSDSPRICGRIAKIPTHARPSTSHHGSPARI